MKIDYVLMSVDDNECYQYYWPFVSKAWEKIGVKPILIKVGYPSKYEGDNIFHVPLLPNYNKAFQSMLARIWGMVIMNGNCLISDIDMMPIDGNYFNGIAEKYEKEKVVSYCSDAKEKFGMIGACYVLSNSNIFKKSIHGLSYTEWVDFVVERFGDGWGHEQNYLEWFVNENNGIHLSRGFDVNGYAFKRLDRDNWDSENPLCYYDAHLPKVCQDPLGKEKIDKLFNLIMK